MNECYDDENEEVNDNIKENELRQHIIKFIKDNKKVLIQYFKKLIDFENFKNSDGVENTLKNILIVT